jgi:hypothetical protein
VGYFVRLVISDLLCLGECVRVCCQGLGHHHVAAAFLAGWGSDSQVTPWQPRSVHLCAVWEYTLFVPSGPEGHLLC